MDSLSLFSIIVAVNEWNVCQLCIKASPDYLAHNQAFHFYENNVSASIAYNRGIKDTIGEYLIFAHQDIYFPAGWFSSVAQTIDKLNEIDPKWAVLGLVGVDGNGLIQGRTWSTGLKREVGSHLPDPILVQSVDELVIILKRKSNIVFDAELPGFHMYGTDIVQIARLNRLSAYVIDAPVIHNSLPYLKFDKHFLNCYRYMQKKWKKILPIKTTVTTITHFGWPLKKRLIMQYFKRDDRRNFHRLKDPRSKAREIGYEK